MSRPLRSGEPGVRADTPGSSLPVARARTGPTRYQVVDALVTIAVMAWFTAALGGMVGEWHGASPAPVTQPEVATDLPAVLPQASARPVISPYARMKLI